jgi:predicted phosphodiesterase
MRIAALYDIHGNLPALEAVLEEVRREGVDQVVVGGDVLPGPMGEEALDLLRSLEFPVHVLRGNGERQTLEVKDGHKATGLPARVVEVLQWTADRLTRDQLAWLRSWPENVQLVIPGYGRVLFCHATPRSDSEILTRLTPEEALVPLFAEVGAELVVCGHTHMQFDRMIGTVRVVNAESVGMPFGRAGAYWLLLGSGVELRRTEYGLAAAAERIRQCSYPHAEEFPTRDVLNPRSEADVLVAFEAIAVGSVR